MDDVTLGGRLSTVENDIQTVINTGASLGLRLNRSKCELITCTGLSNLTALKGFQQLSPDTASLLGAPLTLGPAMDERISTCCADLSRAVERLKLVSSHDALLLLKNSFNASRLQHVLRSANCDGHSQLTEFDGLLRSALCSICNISLTDEQWLQASLPVRKGGLGVRRVSSLASSAFLASAAGTRHLQDKILSKLDCATDDLADTCLTSHVNKYSGHQPSGTAQSKQRAWDKVVVDTEYSLLMSKYVEPYHRARLLAAAAPHSGDWLHALPIASCGLHLDDDAVRVAVGLRLGCALCQAHTCPCGSTVDTLGSHALSCKKNAGRIQRYANLNDLVHRALIRAGIPAVKEPQGLIRDDGKRPDGVTLVPWQTGRSATWDVTVVDTLAASYRSDSALAAGSAAEGAAARKTAKYASLSQCYHFYPVAVETLGPFAASSQEFITEIGRRITQRTLDSRETAYLFQRISIAIQRFNSVCLTNTFTAAES